MHRLIAEMTGFAPVLLLDEVVAHLDPSRRDALQGELAELGTQVWMTGADPALFAEISKDAAFVEVQFRPPQAERGAKLSGSPKVSANFAQCGGCKADIRAGSRGTEHEPAL